MKIYLVEQGCYHEGCSIEKAFINKDKANALCAILEEEIQVEQKNNATRERLWQYAHRLIDRKGITRYIHFECGEITDRLPQSSRFNGHDWCHVRELEVED